jgi:APA family basic amino acid/polyamine antiporter
VFKRRRRPDHEADVMPAEPSRLARRLGLFDAVVIGLGAMIGAGIFVVLAPAARAAGSGLLVGLVIAAAVALCNATSSAQLAALYPESGGTYVYGRRRLGPFWGFLAGWAFVVGKTASCAAMALTFGAYAWPAQHRAVGVAAVVVVTALDLRGVHKTAAATRVVVGIVLVVLAGVVVAGLASPDASSAHVDDLLAGGWRGIVQSAGFLFFAFAGYARIATLGEEVVEPSRTIPRAIPRALAVALAVYALVAVASLFAVGAEALAASPTPLETVVEAGPFDSLVPVVRAGAAIASFGVLLSLVAGVGRTTFAMAANGDVPRWLDAVHPVYRVPHRAELAVGVVVALVVALADVRGAIGFSSFTVLGYYAIANASAWTLPASQRRWPRIMAAAGAAGCVVVAVTLPGASVVAGSSVLVVGSLVWGARAWQRRRRGTGARTGDGPSRPTLP